MHVRGYSLALIGANKSTTMFMYTTVFTAKTDTYTSNNWLIINYYGLY